MIKYLRKKSRTISAFLLVVFFTSLFSSTPAFALTSGPTQPEVQSFQQASASDMVDLFTGDFSYNIPLFELPGPNGGYPFNLSYQAGITIDQEASWVGLGWNLQPGAITRQMRGLPDEFNGDEVITKMSVRPSVTVGLSAGGNLEFFGGDKGLKVGVSVYNNSYKGFGYSIDGSFGFEKATKSGMTGGLGLGLTLDSNEGLTVSPSLSLGGKTGEIGLSSSYNSMSGLSNVGISVDKKQSEVKKNGEPRKDSSIPVQVSSTLSLAHPGYTPQITMPMNNTNLKLTLKGGAAWWGLFGNAYISGFYNSQHLAKETITSKGYGYLNFQNADESSLLDFNREKDGMVSINTPNLGIPSLTYDIYSVTGQGIGMMYRPFRNDYGIVYDQKQGSKGTALGLGVDIGAWASKVGINLDLNFSNSTSGRWNENNAVSQNGKALFQSKMFDRSYEPWYYKVHGEPSAESFQEFERIGLERAASFKLTGNKSNVSLTENMELSGTPGSNLVVANNSEVNQVRKVRSNMITPITNQELLGAGGELLNQYKIKYINEAGTEVFYSRTTWPTHHFAGYTAVTAEGLRYVYGLPAYNFKHEEVTFSVPYNPNPGSIVTVGNNSGGENGDPVYDAGNNDRLLKKTNISKYPHSYLLTAIVGPDYVDVGNDGVDAKDLGYWVKFTYKRVSGDSESTAFKWRDPFVGAHLSQGWKTDEKDDKGSFTYGSREVWYLAKAETKTHVAKFTISSRSDGYGVNIKLQDIGTPTKIGRPVYKLDKVELFTRDAYNTSGVPIKVARFQYNNSLCPGIINSSTGTGKLTLEKMWFEYGGSLRGAANPYEFTYANNRSYDQLAYDRWGYYKPYTAGQSNDNRDFPYCRQDPTPSVKATIDADVSAWSLKSIKLPSGSEILVDYETDDYGYVQQKTAMQMMQIVDPSPSSTSTLSNLFVFNPSNRKVRFKLEKPIPVSGTNQISEVLKYIDQQTWQLYFKVSLKLRKSGGEQYEFVSGYANIDPNTTTMGLETSTDPNNYAYGYFHLVGEPGGTNVGGAVNPIVLRAWQHLRTNQPDLVEQGNNVADKSSSTDRKGEVVKLVPFVGVITKMMKGFNKYCLDLGLGTNARADKSWIRLNSPDKIKYGGGLRVKQITIKDSKWAGATNGKDEEVIYGQVYDYTMMENNVKISSGVATYEPFIGGDENALRYAKKYVESVPLRADNNLFFEYPVNETYFPGPQVGYRQVTVMSLAAAALEGRSILNTSLPSGGTLFPGTAAGGFRYGTSGCTVHEFYTAKDFPVITDETKKSYKHFPLSVTLFGLGNISITNLTNSQGYSIITNDMHGKQKMVSNYRQIKETGKFEPQPISWVRYNYKSEEKMYNKEKVRVLSNLLKDDGDGTLTKVTNSQLSMLPANAKNYLGQEVEMFYDMREYRDIAAGGGLRWNNDVVYIPILGAMVPIPVPTGWPNLSCSSSQLRTSVANKVIFRSGILESVEAFDGGSLVKTENIKWDKITGQVVLSTVTNNFDAPIFNYNKLAYTEYQGMGAAYSTQGLLFLATNVQADPAKAKWYTFSAGAESSLFPGDEILLYRMDPLTPQPVAKVYYVGKVDEANVIHSDNVLTDTDYQCLIVRAGKRNQLSVFAQTITALQDPSAPGSPSNHTKTILIPK